MKHLFFIQYFLFGIYGIVFSQNYWQQEVNYTINVTLDDIKHELNADESIEYINNSPNELSFIYFHLWPNAYKNNSTALSIQLKENGKLNLWYAKPQDRGFIDGLDFKVNGQQVKTEYDDKNIDICKLILNTPLKSGERISITTPFHVKIPLGEFSRMGHIGQQYQITQWYPKPAVYDANGWNQMPYLDQGEFYSEFGTFDVKITVPKNYVLMATGDLVDGEKEYMWLDEIVSQTQKTDLENIKNSRSKNGDDLFPESDKETKTLHFKQNNVHDFAWFCDKRYLVLKGEVILPHSKRKVTTYTMFTPDYAKYWKNSIEYINDAIYYYSKWNGDYQYNYCTAVDGALSAGGGMEYPNITVIGAVNDFFTLETVIMHEVGHNWFYGMLGSNERLHPWMDEGMNSANENRYIRTKYPDRALAEGLPAFFDMDIYKHKAQYELVYMFNCKRNLDQPIEEHAANYTEINYAGIVYSKTAVVFDYLRAYLGDELYDKCMMKYFDEWHFKHPQPNDMRKIVEDVSGKNLSWLFDDLIKSTKKLDYKIISYNRNTKTLTIKNTGEIAGPFSVSTLKNGYTIKTTWLEGFKDTKSFEFDAEDFHQIRIDAMGDMPETNRDNNTLKSKGLFKKVEPTKLQFVFSLNNPSKSQLYWSPVMGWNKYNKYMLGAAFYNISIPEKKIEYVLMPLYSFGNKNLSGYANTTLNIHPKKAIQNLRFSVTAQRYAFADFPFESALNFNKFTPEISIDIKKKRARSNINHSFNIKSVWIIKDSYSTKTEFTPYIYVPKTDTLNFNIFSYVLTNSRTLNPFNIGINLQQSKDFTKLSFESNYEISFRNDKFIQLRAFAGTFVGQQTANSKKYAFRMSGFTGADDYMFDNIFLGRTEYNGILSQQFTENNGAFKAYSSIGASNKWIAALNIKATLPYIPVLRAFADIGTSAYDGVGSNNVIYDVGLYLSFGKGFAEIFVPLLLSADLNDYNQTHDINFLQRIRFAINFNIANPFELIRNFQL